MTNCISPSLDDYHCRVVFNKECGTALKWLRLTVENEKLTVRPGQFVMLDLPDSRFHFRRPFSILDVPEAGVFDLYYKRVGFGTTEMWALKPGQIIRCLGPLGVGFQVPEAPESALYIGGGIGIAPLYFQAKQFPSSGTCIYGVRTQSELGLASELLRIFGEHLYIATDDGSQGFSGNVCQLMSQHAFLVEAAQDAFICGPMKMMAATVESLMQQNPAINIQVSLESHMPCGTGACTGCVITRADRMMPSKVCWEGPVFNASVIDWKRSNHG